MKNKNFFMGLLLSILSILGLNTAYSYELLPVEDFIKDAAVDSLQISPDGKHLSLVFKNKGVDMLGILDAKTRKTVNTFRAWGVGKSIDKVYWINNERLAYTIKQNSDWNNQDFDYGEIAAVNVDGSKHKPIFGYSAGPSQAGTRLRQKKADRGNQQIIDLLKDDEKNILIAFYPWTSSGKSTPIIYKLNVYNAKKKRVGHLPTSRANGITDNEGNVRFATNINDDSVLDVYYKESLSDEWQKFSLKEFKGQRAIPVSFTPDNKNVYFYADVGEGTRALYLFNIEDKSTKKLFHDEAVDISIEFRDFSKKRIVAVGTQLMIPKYHYLEEKDPKAKLHRMLMKAFKGNNVEITSATKDTRYATVHVYSDINSGDFYLFNTKTKNAEFIMSRKSKLYPELMAETEFLEIPTRDKEKISGYLTKPKGKSTDLPLVVLPHGGPHGVRDYWGFDREVQLLANRGYAVLQVNYRGSSGFGWRYQRVGYGEWGTLMQDDITDATRLLIERGDADPNRICIYGASYGGYAALMGTVREPELYQCAIGSAGIYSLPMFIEKSDIAERKSGLAYLRIALGEDLNDQKKRSPVYNVDKINANVLLIHGSQDKRVTIKQAESLKDAFDNINKEYEWLKLSDEAHGYSGDENSIKVYKKILEFLDKNIGDKALHQAKK